jgi:hypothetical protein
MLKEDALLTLCPCNVVIQNLDLDLLAVGDWREEVEQSSYFHGNQQPS